MKSVPITLVDLAGSVLHSDAYAGRLNGDQLAHILEIATKRVGMACLGGRTVDIDLGNGHVLRCTVEQAPKVNP